MEKKTAEQLVYSIHTHDGDELEMKFRGEDIVRIMHEYGRQCFEAGREKINHPDFDYVYEDYEHFSGKELESFSDGE